MKKLTLRNYVGYTAGDMANNLAFALQGMFLLIYYTNVVGLNPAPSRRCSSSFACGMPLPTSWRAVSSTSRDPGGGSFGRTCSSPPCRSCSPASPCSPFPTSASDTAKYVYAYVTYALLGFLYSLVNIPYGSLATAMTQDPVERSRLGVWRSVGPMISILVLVIIVAPQISRLKTDPTSCRPS